MASRGPSPRTGPCSGSGLPPRCSTVVTRCPSCPRASLDYFSRGMLRGFDAATAPKRLIFGPWGHQYPDDPDEVGDWFRHWLPGEGDDPTAGDNVVCRPCHTGPPRPRGCPACRDDHPSHLVGYGLFRCTPTHLRACRPLTAPRCVPVAEPPAAKLPGQALECDKPAASLVGADTMALLGSR